MKVNGMVTPPVAQAWLIDNKMLLKPEKKSKVAKVASKDDYFTPDQQEAAVGHLLNMVKQMAINSSIEFADPKFVKRLEQKLSPGDRTLFFLLILIFPCFNQWLS